MAKISKSFRLSEQAQENLRQLSEQSGSSETAIVEISLAYFSKMMRNSKSDFPVVPEPEYPGDDGWMSRATVKQPQQPVNYSKNYKKKK